MSSPPTPPATPGCKRGGARPRTADPSPRAAGLPAASQAGFTRKGLYPECRSRALPRPRPSCPATQALARLGPEFSGADLKVPLSSCSSGRAAARSLLWDMARRDGSTAEEEQCGVTLSLPGSAGPGEEHSSATAAAYSPPILRFQPPLSAQLTSLWRKGQAAAGAEAEPPCGISGRGSRLRPLAILATCLSPCPAPPTGTRSPRRLAPPLSRPFFPPWLSSASAGSQPVASVFLCTLFSRLVEAVIVSLKGGRFLPGKEACWARRLAESVGPEAQSFLGRRKG